MKPQEKLYEVLGELLYVLVMSDGRFQIEEKEALDKIFEGHPWASQALWSFEYEIKKNSDIDQVYKKVINYCEEHGPAPEYAEFIEAMKQIARAADGIDPGEEKVINSFSKDLLERFIKDTRHLREYE